MGTYKSITKKDRGAPGKVRGRPFTKGPDPRRDAKQERTTALERARAVSPTPLPGKNEPLPVGFSQACEVLLYTHVLPGLMAGLEQRVGSPFWRWAADKVMSFSARPLAPRKEGKVKWDKVPVADAENASLKALRDPGVRKWLKENHPEMVAELAKRAAEVEDVETVLENARKTPDLPSLSSGDVQLDDADGAETLQIDAGDPNEVSEVSQSTPEGPEAQHGV